MPVAIRLRFGAHACLESVHVDVVNRSTSTRPAGVVAAGYAQHRAEMVCHFAAFSAQYADV
eukprot:2412756-Prymnesium_polylepis.1